METKKRNLEECFRSDMGSARNVGPVWGYARYVGYLINGDPQKDQHFQTLPAQETRRAQTVDGGQDEVLLQFNQMGDCQNYGPLFGYPKY